MKAYQLLSFSALIVYFVGCASTPQQHKVALTGDIMVDGPNMIADGPPRDKMLWQYRTASAAMRRTDNLSPSRCSMMRCPRSAEFMARMPRRGKHAGCSTKEARKTFIGEPHERSMAYFIAACSTGATANWTMPAPVSAAPSSRTATPRTKEYKGDWVLPDYLDGLATTKLAGDGSDALKRAKARPQRTSTCLTTIRRRTCCSSWNTAQPAEIRAPVSTVRNYGFARGSPVLSAQLKTGSINLPVAPCDDLNFQATTRGGRVMDHVLANKAVFKKTTDSIGTAAIISGAIIASGPDSRHSHNDEIGLGSFSPACSARAFPPPPRPRPTRGNGIICRSSSASPR